MTIPYKKLHIASSKFKLKSPYTMIPEGICVHNTANDAPAINEANYCRNNNNATSYHIVVDDKEAIEVVPLNRNAFHAGDGAKGEGNRKYIGIEICYSKSGGSRYNKAESNAIKLIAKMLYEYKWSIDRVKKHQDFSGKYCPHRILDKDNGWSDFLSKVKNELDKLNGKNSTVSNAHSEDWKWLIEQGLSDGTNPKGNLTREQFSSILHRYHKKFIAK